MKDNELFWIFSGLFGFLAVATVIGLILKQIKGNTSVISNLNARIRGRTIVELKGEIEKAIEAGRQVGIEVVPGMDLAMQAL